VNEGILDYMKTVISEKCSVCGNGTEFIIDDEATLLREAVCNVCGATIRTADLVRKLVDVMLPLQQQKSLNECKEEFKCFKILNLASTGKIHEMLKESPFYYCGEFFDNVESGEVLNGIRCIDLQNLDFEDEYFDLVITEDVLEHVKFVNKAFKEISRVLKKDGVHVFTVPFHEKQKTVQRDMKVNPVFHGDPLRSEGALVITDFGNDLVDLLKNFNMETCQYDLHRFFEKEEISYVDEEYENYLKNRDDLLKAFRYNSIVFVSKKIKHNEIEFTGERFIPNKVFGNIVVEHYQRYESLLNIVKGKSVLDAACGAGYGSFLLAQKAKTVVGIDISEAAIEFAQENYKKSNVEYKVASIEQLPIEDKSLDIVVSFETIEHVEEYLQEKFIKEIKRVLKPDGILIMSSPDKLTYTDKVEFSNPYHIKEFYYDEFKDFLGNYFDHTKVYRQAVINRGFGIIDCLDYDETLQVVKSLLINKKIPQYFIAMCSNTQLTGDIGSLWFKDEEKQQSYLFYDIGKDFNAEDRFEFEQENNNSTKILYADFKNIKNIRRIRFDPVENLGCICKIIDIKSNIKDIEIKSVNASSCNSEEYTFLDHDPQFIIEGDFNNIEFLEIVYQLKVIKLEEISDVLNDKVMRLLEEKERLLIERDQAIAQRDEAINENNKCFGTKMLNLLKQFK
jgi:ubiquinone/menaquinone biosynthesis C-methylase UbiE